MGRESRVVNGIPLQHWMQHPEEYAKLTDLTTDVNEVCFLSKDGKVIMQGFYIYEMSMISVYFQISLTHVKEAVCTCKSLYDLSSTLRWRDYNTDGKRYKSLEEYRFRNHVGNILRFLENDYVNKDAFDRPGGPISDPVLKSLTDDTEVVKYLIGPITIKFDRYVGSPTGKRSFDYATASVSLIGLSELTKDERIAIVKKHRKMIDAAVVKNLKRRKRYQKYGLPVNFVKCDSCCLMSDCTLVYKLSWKIEVDVI